MKTVEAFCPPDEQNVLSYTMEWHQKHWNGNAKLVRYLAERYQLPKDLRSTVYATQLNQACAIKYGVEHFRRCRGYTMGSIYWQLNDCWPVASWSSIDYYGRYKALHYFAKRFYSKIALGLFNEGDIITINVASESTEPFEGYVKYSIRGNDLSVISEGETSFTLSPLSSLDVKSVPNFEFNRHRDAYFYAELYDKNGNLIAKNTELGTEPKHFKLLKPTIKLDISMVEGGALITLTSDVLAKDVELSLKNHDAIFSDNYFDLASESSYTVFAKTNLTKEELEKELCLFSVYDISK
jgi:beta-mannosidase